MLDTPIGYDPDPLPVNVMRLVDEQTLRECPNAAKHSRSCGMAKRKILESR
jgi:hypothetical protein